MTSSLLTLTLTTTLIAQTFEPQSPTDWLNDVSFPPQIEVEIVAAEPILNGALDLQWDELGRLWVLGETSTERTFLKVGHLTPGGTLERLVTFAADLLPARTFTFADEGILIPQGEKTLWLGDSNEDQVADVTEIRFVGWLGESETGPGHWQRGLDNWIWGTVGETGFKNDTLSESFAKAVYRFRADGSAIDCVQRTRQEPRGLCMTDDGKWLVSFPDNEPIGFLTLPEHLFAGAVGIPPPPLVSHLSGIDVSVKFTDTPSLCLLSAQAFPDTSDLALLATGHGLWIASIDWTPMPPETHAWTTLYRGPDPWHHPIGIYRGRGADLLLLDAYGPLGSENRRLFRLQGSGAFQDPAPLKRTDSDRLAEALRSNHFLERIHAQRLLIETDASPISSTLLEILNAPEIDEHGLDAAALHSLSVLKELQLIHAEGSQILGAVEQAMRHPSGPVRRHAILAYPSHLLANVAETLAPIDDDSPSQVLAVLQALAMAPPSDVFGRMAFERIQSQRWILQSTILRQFLVLAGARHAQSFLQTAIEESTRSDLEAPQFLSVVDQIASHFQGTSDAEAVAELREQGRLAIPELRETLEAAIRRTDRDL